MAWSTELANTIYEQIEQVLDEAQQVVRDALESDDETHKLQAANMMLTQTSARKRRGWGSGTATLDEPEPQPVTVRWFENSRRRRWRPASARTRPLGP